MVRNENHNLSKSDYIKILKYYNIRAPKSTKTMKNKAEQILAEKMCKCIKKIGTNDEPRSIGICTKTVINRKGYIRGNFKCTKGRNRKRAITLKKRT